MRQRRDKPAIGKDAFRVMDGNNVLAEEGNRMLALVTAQHLAEDVAKADYIVTRETVGLKESIVQLYRVVGDGGVVTTHVLNEED